jgi:hypothetical protein
MAYTTVESALGGTVFRIRASRDTPESTVVQAPREMRIWNRHLVTGSSVGKNVRRIRCSAPCRGEARVRRSWGKRGDWGVGVGVGT